MGWIETTPDGQQVEHGHQLTNPHTGRVVDGDLEQWLADLSLGPDVARSGFVDRYGQAHVPTTPTRT